MEPAPSSATPSLPTPGTKFYIKTYGCQMNEADSERMGALLSEQGMTPAGEADDADLILINGCTVREKAVHKALSILGRYKELKGDPGDARVPTPVGKRIPLIGMAGCVGQIEKQKLFRRAPYLDFVLGTDTIDELPEVLHRVRSGERHVVYADFDRSQKYSTETKVLRRKSQAFVNIMKGCDKYCTYCIVPFTRGKEKSRTIDEVVEDVARLVSRGVREVTLLGQNVNSFGKGNPNTAQREPLELHNVIGKVGPRAGEENFPQLLRAIDSDPRCAELKRIRFTSSHPLDFSDELIECYAPAEKGGVMRLAPYLHLPVQCGSNRVLQKMGRHHQVEGYIAQMDRLRELCPDVGLTTDLIVGFPGESEEDFQETLRLLDRIQYDNVYAFAYSARPGTRAAKLVDDVPADVKNDRLNRLLAHQLEISERRMRLRVGKTVEVLVENEAKNHGLLDGVAAAPEQRVWAGKAPCFATVNFQATTPRDLTGSFLQVKILASGRLSVQGELV